MTSTCSFGDLCLSTSTLSLNSVTINTDNLVTNHNNNNGHNMLKSPSSPSSSSTSSSLTSGLHTTTSSSLREETTFASNAFTYKWTLVGYPFTTSVVRSEDFSSTEINGDVWCLQLDPPKLRVDKTTNGNERGIEITTSSSGISVYSTSTQNMQTIHPTPPPPIRFASTGFDYTTECMLSLILKRRGIVRSSDGRDMSSLKIGFEISISSSIDPSKSLQTWVSLSESFTPFSDYPTKILSFRGKIVDLVTTHKLSTMIITCRLFYSTNVSTVVGKSSPCDTFGSVLDGAMTEFPIDNHSLVSDVKKYFNDVKRRKLLGTDVTLVGIDGKVEAHRFILASRSSVFRDVLEKDFHNSNINDCHNQDNRINLPQIKMYGVPLKILRLFVTFLYTDTIQSDDLKDCNVELLLLADKYNIPKLKSICEHSIARSIKDDNYSDIVTLCRTIKSSLIQRKLHEFFNQ